MTDTQTASPETGAPEAPSVLDRPAAGGLTVEKWIFVILFAIGIGLRFYHLGVRPYHHDESIHAVFSWKIVQEGVKNYNYDPVYHGPVLYYSSALIMALFGDNDFTGRLSAVLFGFAVMAFAWPLRRYLGRWGALTFLALVVFSPTWTYFTRFLRHDIYLAALNLGAVYFAFRYGDTNRARNLYFSAACISLGFCDKEDMYLTSPIFAASLVGMLLWSVLRREQSLGEVLGETGTFLKRSIVPIVTSLFIFAIIWAILYTSFFTRPENWNAVGRAIDYWWGQHKIKRIGGSWFYYVPELLLYEPLITLPALAAMVMAVLQKPSPDRFTRFLVFWGLGTLFIYAWAQEKVPWLLIPQLLPLTLLAARWFGRLIERGAIKKPLVAIPLTAVGALTLWSLIAANFLYDAPQPSQPADHRRETMLSYVQSTYDVTDVVMKRIEQVAAAAGTGEKTRLAISGDATWPFSWYVRHYPVNWAANLRNIDQPVLIVDKKLGPSHDEALGELYDKVPFEIRGWWEPKFRLGSPTLGQFFRWLIFRDAWSPLGSSDAILYVRKNVEPGKTTYPVVQVNPPPAARGYSQRPKFIEPVAVWGSEGSERGQFREPRAIALNAAGEIYVVDKGNNRIQKLSPNGEVLAVWGSQGDGDGQFKDPHGIAVGPDGSVYVADTWNHRIEKFDPQGKFITKWNATDQSLWGPRAVVVGADGNVYVADTGNKRIVYFSDEGVQIDTWGGDGSGPGQMIEPVGLAIDDLGEVVVADTGNRRLQFFLDDGTFQKEWPVDGWEEFYTEPYIAVDGGAVYVTDSHEHRFARYEDGKLTGVWGKSGSSAGEFNRPIGIAIGNGRIYVSDTFNNRIQVFDIPPE